MLKFICGQNSDNEENGVLLCERCDDEVNEENGVLL